MLLNLMEVCYWNQHDWQWRLQKAIDGLKSEGQFRRQIATSRTNQINEHHARTFKRNVVFESSLFVSMPPSHPYNGRYVRPSLIKTKLSVDHVLDQQTNKKIHLINLSVNAWHSFRHLNWETQWRRLVLSTCDFRDFGMMSQQRKIAISYVSTDPK